MLPNHHLVVSAVSTEFSPVVVFGLDRSRSQKAGQLVEQHWGGILSNRSVTT